MSVIISNSIVSSKILFMLTTESFKGRHCWSFVKGIQWYHWIPVTNDQWYGRLFHMMTSSCNESFTACCPHLTLSIRQRGDEAIARNNNWELWNNKSSYVGCIYCMRFIWSSFPCPQLSFGDLSIFNWDLWFCMHSLIQVDGKCMASCCWQ